MLAFLIAWLAAAPMAVSSGVEASDAGPEAPASRVEAYVRFLTARGRERVGDVDGAVKEYEKAVKADPESQSLRVALANLLAESHRVAEAMDILREALRRDETHVPTRRLLAMILLRLRAEPHGEAYEREVRIAFEELVRLAPDDLEARRALGKIAYEQRDFDAARESFERIQKERPDDMDARIFLARTYFQQREYARAAEIYADIEKESERFGGLPEGERSGQALTYLFAERFDEAIRVADEGIRATGEDSPEHLKFLKLKAYAADGTGDHGLAARTLSRVLDLDPGDREVRFRLAQSQMKRRAFGAALSELLAVRREIEASPAGPDLDPPYPQVLLSLGTIHLERKRYGDAEEALETAMAVLDEKDRLRPGVVEKLARSYFENGQRPKAYELLQKSLAARPEAWELTIDLAELYLRDGQTQEGGRIVQSLLKKPPADRRKEALLSVADLYQRLRRYDDAVAILEEALEELPADEDVYFLLGSVHERAARLPSAERAFRKALAINPRSDRSMNYLGYMLADRGQRLEESQQLILKAVELDRHNGAYLDSLGWVQFKRGDLNGALQSLERAVEQLADDPVIHDHLAQVYFGLERYDDAVAAWERALDLGAEEPDAIRARMEEARARRASRKE